jgi:protein involved in polysaccharide export with SLBB domain
MKICTLLVLILAVILPNLLRAETPALLRVGDTIELRLSGAPSGDNVDGSYTIHDDGTINLPNLGKVKIAGLSPAQVEELIQNRYVDAKIYNHPVVNVQQNSVPRFVNVLGEVHSPQRATYTADMTLMTVITACGGFTDFANKAKVDVKRGDTVTHYNCVTIEHAKAADPALQPGDIITVHQGF